MDGWISLHRKILENPIFQKAELLQLFIYCILKANHKPNRIVFNGKEMVVGRGQFITGRDALSREIKAKSTTTWKRLKVLENLQILNIKSNNKFSLVTVVNYGFYQSNLEESDSKSDNKGTTREQQRDTNNNDNNVNNDNNPSGGAAEVIDFYQKYLGDHNVTRQKDLLEYLKKGLEIDVIIESIRDSVTGQNPTKYLFGILDACVKEKINTLQSYIDRKKKHQDNIRILQSKKKNEPKQHEIFERREYSDDELESHYMMPSEGM